MDDEDNDRSGYVYEDRFQRSPSPETHGRPESVKYFFRPVNIFVAFFVLAGMTLCHLGCYSPHLVPDESLGIIGSVYDYLVYTHPSYIQWIYHSALVVHLLEAIYSIRATRAKGILDTNTRIMWFFQTLLFGSFSLMLLSDRTDRRVKFFRFARMR